MSVIRNSSDMEEFFRYELAPQPPSLFHDGVMRKTQKSALGDLLKGFVDHYSTIPENSIYVIDGGYLLHKVIWSTPSSYGDISQMYITYVLKHYGVGTTVVFDGYSDVISTKVVEQSRRAQRNMSSDIIFDDNTPTRTSQASFLSNSHNKSRLIEGLIKKMPNFGIRVKQAEADGDALIISTALDVVEAAEVPVVVVGTDTDLLVMLLARAIPSTNIFMLCCNIPTILYYTASMKLNML